MLRSGRLILGLQRPAVQIFCVLPPDARMHKHAKRGQKSPIAGVWRRGFRAGNVEQLLVGVNVGRGSSCGRSGGFRTSFWI